MQRVCGLPHAPLHFNVCVRERLYSSVCVVCQFVLSVFVCVRGAVLVRVCAYVCWVFPTLCLAEVRHSVNQRASIISLKTTGGENTVALKHIYTLRRLNCNRHQISNQKSIIVINDKNWTKRRLGWSVDHEDCQYCVCLWSVDQDDGWMKLNFLASSFFELLKSLKTLNC